MYNLIWGLGFTMNLTFGAIQTLRNVSKGGGGEQYDSPILIVLKMVEEFYIGRGYQNFRALGYVTGS